MSSSVEAVVVNYNSGDHLNLAVESLLNAGVEKIWIVDNGSTDGSVDLAAKGDPSVQVLTPGENLGYGKAVNFAFQRSGGKYFLVCNPDIELDSDSVANMVVEIEGHGECALVGPRILNSDDSIYPSVRRFPNLVDSAGHALLGQFFPNNPFTRRYRLLDMDHKTSFAADWVSGACFLVRSDIFSQVGGFDPAFFMYLEDVYLCRQIGKLGYTVRYCGKAVVRHWQGVSTSKRPLTMIFAHHKSLWTYSKLTKTGWRKFELPLVGIGIVVRLLVSLLIAVSKREIKKPRVDLI
jgi:N-acetylglucosaminyl-diphospho-decaprenol L-rhamnosyltransferase